MTATTCANCSLSLTPQRDWERASRQQRSAWASAGVTMHQAHGLCRACYMRRWKTGNPVKPPPRPFSSRYTVSESGCWEWLGALSSGYGQLQVNKVRWLAHRYSYTLAGREIPDGYEVDHLCRNRKCVNPEHLEAVTQYENNMRSSSPAALHARQTHCKQGHEFTIRNTYISPNGCRRCRTCTDASRKRYLARRRGVAA